MRLPNTARAIIEERKVRDYLLSPIHPIGRFKAALFAQLGYAQADWSRLAEDLRAQHLTCEAEELGTTPHGRKYRIRAPLVGPNDKQVELISIWITRQGEDRPSLVTAYPGGGT